MCVNPSHIQVIEAKGFPPDISQVNITMCPSITGPIGIWVIVGIAGESEVVSKYYNVHIKKTEYREKKVWSCSASLYCLQKVLNNPI